VFRQTSRGTVVSVAPQAPAGRPRPGQPAHPARFQQAVIHAKGPAVWAAYADEAKAQKSACTTWWTSLSFHAEGT